MQPILSDLTSRIRPSLMFKYLEKAKAMEEQGIDVFHLEKGEVELGTPPEIVKGGKEAMDKGLTKLTPSRGFIQLRRAIEDYMDRLYGLQTDPDEEILVVPGSKFGVFAALAAVCNPGDEVLCPSPFFPPHREGVEMLGAKFVPVPLIREDGQATLRRVDLESRMNARTKAMLINYPHNPTGWVPSRDELASIADFLSEHDLYVVSDEVYEHLTFDGVKHTPMPAFETIRKRCIYVNSFSKSFAMTGWRLGWCVAERDIMAAMAKVQQNLTTCAPSITQYAGITALREAGDFAFALAARYQERRDLVLESLRRIPGIRPLFPRGTFFVFMDISQLGISSVGFADRILESAHIALSPGKAFGDEWDAYIRISVTEDKDKLSEALERLGKFVTGF